MFRFSSIHSFKSEENIDVCCLSESTLHKVRSIVQSSADVWCVWGVVDCYRVSTVIDMSRASIHIWLTCIQRRSAPRALSLLCQTNLHRHEMPAAPSKPQQHYAAILNLTERLGFSYSYHMHADSQASAKGYKMLMLSQMHVAEELHSTSGVWDPITQQQTGHVCIDLQASDCCAGATNTVLC